MDWNQFPNQNPYNNPPIPNYPPPYTTPYPSSTSYEQPNYTNQYPYPYQQNQPYSIPPYQQPPPTYYNTPAPYTQPPMPTQPPPPPSNQYNIQTPSINYGGYHPVSFQPLSRSGKKKALLIGINYLNDPKCRLRGAINDALNMKRFLMENYGFQDDSTSMVVLSDDQQDFYKQPTRQNIINAMQWLIGGTQAGDSLFFHYSGHGSQVIDHSGDEEDGLDETICPVDFRSAGQITDDEIRDILVLKLPYGVHLTALMDCCHSGTGFDLPFTFTPSPSSSTASSWTSLPMKANFNGRRKLFNYNNNIEQSMGDVVLFSGCRDDQTSADTTIGIVSGGAMTNAFISSLKANRNPSYIQLLYSMRASLSSGPHPYTQIPQLSSEKPMDMNQLFVL